MTPTETAILSAVISSSILVVGLEFISNKLFARVNYRGWQAVFLANDQVYFGKIPSVTRNDIRLTHIYYLKDGDKNAGYPTRIKNSNLSLVKLGDEVHGPKDQMIIGRAHVIFIESLKDSAEVVEEIKQFELGEKLADIQL